MNYQAAQAFAATQAIKAGAFDAWLPALRLAIMMRHAQIRDQEKIDKRQNKEASHDTSRPM